jgi:hypothetical protein
VWWMSCRRRCPVPTDRRRRHRATLCLGPWQRWNTVPVLHGGPGPRAPGPGSHRRAVAGPPCPTGSHFLSPGLAALASCRPSPLSRLDSRALAHDAAGTARESAGRPGMTPDTWPGGPGVRDSRPVPGVLDSLESWTFPLFCEHLPDSETAVAATAQRGRGPEDLKPANLRRKSPQDTGPKRKAPRGWEAWARWGGNGVPSRPTWGQAVHKPGTPLRRAGAARPGLAVRRRPRRHRGRPATNRPTIAGQPPDSLYRDSAREEANEYEKEKSTIIH